VKNNQYNQIQSITLCNMYFFEKGRPIRSVQWGLMGQSPRSLGIFQNFCVKSKLTVLKLSVLLCFYSVIFSVFIVTIIIRYIVLFYIVN